MAKKEITPGQKYRSADGNEIVWEIEGVYTDTANLAHARLRNVRDPYDKRSLACSVLLDTSRFRPFAAA
ncbi:MAG: hypothetical protein ACTS3R_07330 [Inquilinaceae bacterium]